MASSGGSQHEESRRPRAAVDADEEHFVVLSSAYCRNLMTSVTEKHPLLAPMMPTMMVLVDGFARKT